MTLILFFSFFRSLPKISAQEDEGVHQNPQYTGQHHFHPVKHDHDYCERVVINVSTASFHFTFFSFFLLPLYLFYSPPLSHSFSFILSPSFLIRFLSLSLFFSLRSSFNSFSCLFYSPLSCSRLLHFHFPFHSFSFPFLFFSFFRSAPKMKFVVREDRANERFGIKLLRIHFWNAWRSRGREAVRLRGRQPTLFVVLSFFLSFFLSFSLSLSFFSFFLLLLPPFSSSQFACHLQPASYSLLQ